MNKEEILYNKIYEQTKEFGRTHFIKEIMRLQRENQQLKEKNNRLKEQVLDPEYALYKAKKFIEEDKKRKFRH
ncbi:MAG: hypothetical protein IJZ77_04855 [Bacilli bacterium]|nr:hypothetical protein [Bacilli bacterium]